MRRPFIALTLSLIATSSAFAQAHPTLPAPSLEPIQLTREEVAERDQKLAPIYNYYATVNVAQVANALEETYGLNVYHHVIGGDWTPQSIANKRAIMAAAVQDTIRDTRVDYDGADVPTMTATYGLAAASLLSRLDWSELDIRSRIEIDNLESADLAPVTGDMKHTASIRSTPFTITTELVKNDREVMSGFDPVSVLSFGLLKHPWQGFPTHSFGLFSSTMRMSVERPQPFRLLLALRDARIKALDATVVFVNSKDMKVVDYNTKSELVGIPASWKVIYPAFSRVAPIPQPMIFISDSATDQDLADMLKTEAPLIFAYNKLFDQQILPQHTALMASLAKISTKNAEVARLARFVGQANAHEAMNRAFLSVAYGILATTTAPAEVVVRGGKAAAVGAYRLADNTLQSIYDIMTTPTYEDVLIYSPSYGFNFYSSTSISQSVEIN